MSPVHRSRRRWVVLAATVALAAALVPGARPAVAEPNGIRSTDDVAAEVGRLGAQLSQADADLRQASVAVSVAVEKYERAKVDAQRTQRALTAAKARTRDAARRVDRQQAAVGDMARRNYELGGTVGAMAMVAAGTPSDMITNLGYLSYVGDHQARTLGSYRQAKGRAVLAEGTARSAYRVAEAARRKAGAAKAAAQRAVAQRGRTVADLKARRAGVQRQLDDIESHNTSVRRAAAAADRRRAATQAADRRNASTATSEARGSSSGGAMVAVRAALAQLGKPYVWDAADPSVGFDCSGLALYAYEQIGIELPHSAEYQYLQGRHVSSDRLRPGDLLFYSYNGQVSGIHHVTMYIGGGQIVQAADFGIPVQVVPAYFSFGYIGATRLA
ncbi:MAG TPA: C40 family peptidase [Actinocatenispora sp.]